MKNSAALFYNEQDKIETIFETVPDCEIHYAKNTMTVFLIFTLVH